MIVMFTLSEVIWFILNINAGVKNIVGTIILIIVFQADDTVYRKSLK